MERDICHAKIKKQNKKKHEQSKKHKNYCSNLIINKYIVNKDEFDNFKDFFESHYVDHKKKFNSFGVLRVFKMNGEVSNKVNLPPSLVMEKKYAAFGKVLDGECGIKPCYKYIDDSFFIDNLYDEIIIIFISDFKDITFYHFMNQPKSMLSRKLIINLLQNQSGDYTHKWLSKCFVYNYIPTDE